MRTILLISQVFLALAFSSKPEQTDFVKIKFEVKPIDAMTVKPYFKGGFPRLYKYLSANIKYPSQLKRGEIESKIFVSFVINKRGEVTNAEVIKGSKNAKFNKQISKVFNQMPVWVNEQKVSVRDTISFPFDIE